MLVSDYNDFWIAVDDYPLCRYKDEESARSAMSDFLEKDPDMNLSIYRVELVKLS